MEYPSIRWASCSDRKPKAEGAHINHPNGEPSMELICRRILYKTSTRNANRLHDTVAICAERVRFFFCRCKGFPSDIFLGGEVVAHWRFIVSRFTTILRKDDKELYVVICGWYVLYGPIFITCEFAHGGTDNIVITGNKR